MKTKKLLFKNIRIYAESETIDKGFVKVKDGKIVEIGTMKDLNEYDEYKEISLPNHAKMLPGFIDVHIHGVNGADTMDATKEAMDIMARSLPQEGTTSFLATTMTQEKSKIEKALANAGDYIIYSQLPGNAEVLGIHLEGPFINAKMAGAQPKQHIIDPEIDLFKQWQNLSNDQIKVVTLAPEINGGIKLVQYLKKTGCVVSIGHSDATYHETIAALEAGASQVTHLYNQMRGMHHREPGVVGATFLHHELKAELIVDGVHVRPEIVNIAFKHKGNTGIILITDSMRAKCLKDGTYDLGGQSVKVEEEKAVLSDGTLAGSIVKLGQAVKNIIKYTNCSLRDAIQMVAVNPAKQLNIFNRKGSIATSKDADIVILDEHNEIIMTFCLGEVAYIKGGGQ